jgi:sugar phosphate isomerase/epimerase
MYIGALTARFDKTWDLDRMIAWAAKSGIDCLEVAIKSGHLDPAEMLKKKPREELQKKLKSAKVFFSSLAYYGTGFASPDPAARKAEIDGLLKTIEAAEALGLDTVCTLAGMPLPGKSKMDTIREALPDVFGPILAEAKKRGVRIALENWFATNIQHLDHWKTLFELLPQDNFGLNFDPSHLDRMDIDYLAAVDEFAKRIFHTHAKDVEVNESLRRRIGTLDSAHARYTIPGTGRIHWGLYIGKLRKAGYNGVLSIEHEDSTLSAEDGFRIGAAHLRALIA